MAGFGLGPRRVSSARITYATNAPLYPYTTFSLAVGRERTEFSEAERAAFDRFTSVVAPQFVRELRWEVARRGEPLNGAKGHAGGDEQPLMIFADLATSPAVDPVAAHFGLTPRESEVLHWLAVGKTNPEIALILGTGVRTVQSQVISVFEKLGVENRLAAARIVWLNEVRA
ncbi:MAG: helix-turn-helix transcriptional regulator [Opitutales bacterium]